MSGAVTTWAWAQSERAPSPSALLVLLRLADHAHDDGKCWPSQATIAKKIGLSERCVRDALKALEEAGLIVRERRNIGAERTSDMIILVLTETILFADQPANSVVDTNRQILPKRPAKSAGKTSIEPSKKRSAARTRGSRLAADWVLPDEGRAHAIDKGIDPDAVDVLAEAFHNHWLARAGEKGVMLDWPACWRTWVGNDIKWRKERTNGTARRQPTDREDKIASLRAGTLAFLGGWGDSS